MTIAEFLPARPHPLWKMCLQIGVRHAIVKCAPELTGRPAPDDRDALAAIVKEFGGGGFVVAGLEGDQFDMSRIKLGLDGRDDDLERYQRMLANMGEFGIRLLCYNFMAGVGWYRSGSVSGRGGALCTRFRAADAPATTPLGRVEPGRLWENYEYFLRAVLPEARRHGIRMGLHPDDPPLPSLSGIARIFGTVDAFDRAYHLAPEFANAITFCQANFKLMGCNLAEAVRHLGSRIAFVHVRDVRGTASDFVELFHDEMEIDQAALFLLYRELGLDVPLRCDHVPTLHGDERHGDHIPGYGTLGRLFAIGYLKGLLEALDRLPGFKLAKPLPTRS
jgi:mannonate dehydratase